MGKLTLEAARFIRAKAAIFAWIVAVLFTVPAVGLAEHQRQLPRERLSIVRASSVITRDAINAHWRQQTRTALAQATELEHDRALLRAGCKHETDALAVQLDRTTKSAKRYEAKVAEAEARTRECLTNATARVSTCEHNSVRAGMEALNVLAACKDSLEQCRSTCIQAHQ
jgi:hypothetical protein